MASITRLSVQGAGGRGPRPIGHAGPPSAPASSRRSRRRCRDRCAITRIVGSRAPLAAAGAASSPTGGSGRIGLSWPVDAADHPTEDVAAPLSRAETLFNAAAAGPWLLCSPRSGSRHRSQVPSFPGWALRDAELAEPGGRDLYPDGALGSHYDEPCVDHRGAAQRALPSAIFPASSPLGHSDPSSQNTGRSSQPSAQCPASVVGGSTVACLGTSIGATSSRTFSATGIFSSPTTWRSGSATGCATQRAWVFGLCRLAQYACGALPLSVARWPSPPFAEPANRRSRPWLRLGRASLSTSGDHGAPATTGSEGG